MFEITSIANSTLIWVTISMREVHPIVKWRIRNWLFASKNWTAFIACWSQHYIGAIWSTLICLLSKEDQGSIQVLLISKGDSENTQSIYDCRIDGFKSGKIGSPMMATVWNQGVATIHGTLRHLLVAWTLLIMTDDLVTTWSFRPSDYKT